MFDEISKFLCPDCGTALTPRFTLLTDDGRRAVHVSRCPKCADGATVRAYVSLTASEWREMERAGIPVVSYR